MEQEKKSLEDEVYELTKEIAIWRQKTISKKKQSLKSWRTSIVKWSNNILVVASVLFILLISVDVFARLIPIVETRLILLVVLLLTMLLTLISSLYFDDSTKSFMRDPTGDLLELTALSNRKDVVFLNQLADYSTESIRFVAGSLINKKETLNSAIGLFVGAFAKVGIGPALIATLVAISKVNESSGISVYEFLAYALLGLYFVGFKVGEASIKYERYVFLLNYCLEMRERECRKAGG